MEISLTSSILTIALLTIYLIFLNRNDSVLRFRERIEKLCYNYWIKHRSDDSFENPYSLIYEKMPSYNEMLFSFKPLKEEYWLSKEDINKLNS